MNGCEFRRSAELALLERAEDVEAEEEEEEEQEEEEEEKPKRRRSKSKGKAAAAKPKAVTKSATKVCCARQGSSPSLLFFKPYASADKVMLEQGRKKKAAAAEEAEDDGALSVAFSC